MLFRIYVHTYRYQVGHKIYTLNFFPNKYLHRSTSRILKGVSTVRKRDGVVAYTQRNVVK